MVNISHTCKTLIALSLMVFCLATSSLAEVSEGLLSLDVVDTLPQIWLLLLLAVLTFASEDMTCIAAGLLVSRGSLGFLPATLACLVGIFVGDILLYLAGKHLGRPLVKRVPFKWFIREGHLERSAQWFSHQGAVVILTTRFVPGSRLPTYVAAGVLKMSPARFFAYFLAAAMLWTPLLVGGAVMLGRVAYKYLAIYQDYALPVCGVLLLLAWVIIRFLIPLFSYRGRRLLVHSWRRLVRWEFWPPWLFYPPVLAYILYLGIRYRSLTLFTAVNPAILAGGFLGESKTKILKGLDKHPSLVAKSLRIEASANKDEQTQSVSEFMKTNGFEYPIVLKPDVGQRGTGVAVICSNEERDAYLSEASWNILLQEYAPGAEFGIFYYRFPGEAKGHILSITEKQFPAVVGDGVSTLERLILADDRAVCMAPLYLDRHARKLFDVPDEGERIQLVELGTHCRGALFLDGEWVKTPALEEVIDDLSRDFDGFYFGRYDMRTPSIEEFQQGKGFKIVELNGVTSEATHIYDPKNSLREAYRVLMKQWRLAFEISSINKKLGVIPLSMTELAKIVAHYDAPHLN